MVPVLGGYRMDLTALLHGLRMPVDFVPTLPRYRRSSHFRWRLGVSLRWSVLSRGSLASCTPSTGTWSLRSVYGWTEGAYVHVSIGTTSCTCSAPRRDRSHVVSICKGGQHHQRVYARWCVAAFMWARFAFLLLVVRHRG